MLFWYALRFFTFKELKIKFSKHYGKYWLLLASYFLFILVHSLFFHGDFNKLSLALLPLIYFSAFALIYEEKKHSLKFLSRCFLLGSALFIPFILGIGLFRFGEFSWNGFFYTDLLDPIKANPITHALYYNVALILTAQHVKQAKEYWKKIGYGILMLAFIAILILFGSKIGYITALISIFFLGLNLLSKLIYKLAFLVLIPLSIYLIFAEVPYVNKKIKGFKWQVSRHDVISLDNRLPRSIIWPEAISLIKEKPLTGYGFGRGYESLSTRYEAIGYTKGIENHFNAHNQFLESSLQLGIFALFWWIVTLSYVVAAVVKQRDPWLANFLLIALAYLAVESLLESQMGTVGFSFFLAYFLFNALNEQTTSNKI